MKKIVINQCYCDSFDISTRAKEMLRQNYGIIFDPNFTPRDDPALVQVVEFLGEEAAVYTNDASRGNERTYFSKPVVVSLPPGATYEITNNFGNEMIRCIRRKRAMDDLDENMEQSKRLCL